MAVRINNRRKLAYGLVSAAVLAASQLVSADNFTWTGTTSSSWNLTDANWDNTTLPATGVPWSNNVVTTTPNSATFSLAVPPAAITVDATIFTGQINLTTTGWNLAAGTGSLSFGDVGTITLNNTGGVSTIGATIQDTGAAATAINLIGGNGPLTLSGTNTYTGGTTLTSGELQIDSFANIGSGNITFAGGALGITGTGITSIDSRIANPSTFSGAIGVIDPTNTLTLGVGLGGTTFNKYGAGTLSLAAALTNTGTTTISAGTLRINGGTLSSASVLSISAGATAAAAGTLDLNGTAQTVAGLQGGTNTFNGLVTNSAASTTAELIVNSTAAQTFSGNINDGAGAVRLTKNGAGVLTLASANNYTGPTKVLGGTLSVSSDANLGAGTGPGNIILDGGTLQLATNSFTLNSARGITLGGTTAGGTIDVFTTTNSLPGNTVTYSGIIADGSTANSLTKTGNGNLVLAHANTYSGTTAISGRNFSGTGTTLGLVGALVVAADGALGTADGTAATGTTIGIGSTNGVLAFQGGVNYTGNELITVAAGSFASGSIRSTTGNNTFSGNIILNSTNGGFAATNLVTFGVDAGSQLTLNGVISSPSVADSLVKVGAGTLVLNNANTYTGSTNIAFAPGGSADTPGLNANNVNGGGGLLFPAGTVVLGRSASGTFGTFSNSARVNVGSTGTLTIDNSTKTAGDPVSITRMDITKNFNLGNGGVLNVIGSANANTNDLLGILFAGGDGTVKAGGMNTINITPGAGMTSTLTVAQIARNTGTQGPGTLLVSGPNFGAATGANVAQLISSGAINTGSTGSAITFNTTGTAVKVIPYLFVRDTATNTTSLSTNDVNGVRPINEASETTTTLTANQNFLVNSSGATVAGTTAIPTLTIRGNNAVVGGTGQLTIRGQGSIGTILSTGTGNVINANINASDANNTNGTMIFYVEGDLTVNGAFGAGTFQPQGFAKTGSGELILTNTTNNVRGNTATNGLNPLRLDAGTLTISSINNLVPTGAASPVQFNHTGGTLRATGGGVVDFAPNPAGLPGTTTQGVTYALGTTGATTGLDPSQLTIQVDASTQLRLGTLVAGNGSVVSGFVKTGAGEVVLTDVDNGGGSIGTTYLRQGQFTLGDNSYETGAAPTKFGTYQTYGQLLSSPGTTTFIDSSKGLTASLIRLGGLTLNHSTLRLDGNAANATIDRIRNTVLIDTGANAVNVNAGAGQTTELRLGTLARNAGGVVTFTGSNVGSATGPNVVQIRIGALPLTISGLNTTAATPIPFAVVNDTAAGTTLFATYDSTVVDVDTGTGSIRSLKSTEMTADAVTAAQNVRLTTSNAAGTISIKSLTLQNAGTTTDLANSGTLTVTSGGILSTGTVGNSITGGTLAFGASEGIVHSFSDLLISSIVSGSSGLTKSGTGTLTLSNANTYTGANTWINQGAVSAAGSSSLGASNVGVVMQAGTSLTVTGAGQTLSDNRALSLPSVGNRNIDVNDATSVFGFVGGVSGTGNVTKGGAGALVLNSNATPYTGSVTVNAGTLGGSLNTTGSLTLNAANPHTVAPSAGLAPTAATTMTVASVATNANTTLAFNLVTPGANSVNDKLVVTANGGLTLGSGTKVVITGNGVGAGSLGYYKAIQYTGTFSGVYNSTAITMPAMDANKVVYTLDIAHNPGFIDIHRGFSGDANDDGTVTFADFVALSNNFTQVDKGWAGGDFNGDGVTNFTDFVSLSNNFGQTVGGGSIVVTPEEWAGLAAFGAAASSAVPEPASLAVLGIGAAALLTRRKRKA